VTSRWRENSLVVELFWCLRSKLCCGRRVTAEKNALTFYPSLVAPNIPWKKLFFFDNKHLYVTCGKKEHLAHCIVPMFCFKLSVFF